MKDFKHLNSLGFLVLVLMVLVLGAPLSAVNDSDLKAEVLAGLKLRTIGPAAMSGRIIDFAVVEKDPYTFYVASATGGLWKTTNNGVTFKPVFEKESTHSIGDVVVHQVETDIVWVGTGERFNRQSSSWGDGVYKSIDGGKAWKNMGLRDSQHIGRIIMHPEDANIVYVAAMGHLWGDNEERGLYKTADGGESWKKVLHIDESTGVVDVAMDPSDSNILYAAAYQRQRKPFGFHGGGPGSGLYKSVDGGETWKELTNGLPEGDKGRIGISIYRKDPRIVYVCVEQGYRYTASTSYEKRLGGVYRSEDKGETWTFMSDWNPRPNYGSQIVVDPNDDQRIYMMSFSYSDDGGKTFKGRHGDDRFVWVNPKDSRHLMLAYDQGMAISYDRGRTWLFIGSLPVSQFYRVGVDMRKPYWVYGGLQDNGSWAGPSATYRSEGVVNSDWIRTGGGDGFVNLVHPENENILLNESQYLYLGILDLKTGQSRDIRPENRKGNGGPNLLRRNWDAWGPGLPEPELGNALSPANWDGPFIFSPHDANTIYAGTSQLWRSRDLGESWTSLGVLTTGINRRELKIMGQRAHEYTASLDDGAPYYPTITVVAESPLREGLLYVGTDDGNLQVSMDGGLKWENVTERMPGSPAGAWISGIEASRFAEGTVYVAVNNYRNDDFQNYLYKSTDFGRTWISIVSDLPENRVLRIVREDLKNPGLLFVGAELGLFLTIDGGKHWVELKNNMPTAPFNDMVIHPRDNDLVLATHGRGIWILDNITALQELTPEVLMSDGYLFSLETAEQIRYSGARNRSSVLFRGENPPAGAIIDYYLREKQESGAVNLTILDSDGEKVKEIKPSRKPGINRLVWDMRYANFPKGVRAPRGPLVNPGVYTVRLTVGETSHERQLTVKEDPRLDVSAEDRAAWTRLQFEIADLYIAVLAVKNVVNPIQKQVVKLAEKDVKIEESVMEEVKELDRLINVLFYRVSGLYGGVSRWVGPLTQDQQSQFNYYKEMQEKLQKRMQILTEKTVPELNKKLSPDDQVKIKR